MPNTNYTHTQFRDPDRGFRIWHISEIVTQHGQGQWVPNVGDLVMDDVQGFLRVMEVEPVSHLSTLEPWTPVPAPPEEELRNRLVGVGPGYPSETFRIYLDQAVTPHTLTPEKRLHFYGSDVASYRVFRGSVISEEQGEIISACYDASNNFLGTAIPVESVEVPGATTTTVKAPKAGHTNHELSDGELVTLVAYGIDGKVVSTAQLLVKNTRAIRMADAGLKYVSAISLDTPFLSPADPNTIEFPINVPVDGLPLHAKVHYSDGSTHRLAIDGSRFSLFGLANYIPTVIGKPFPLVLSYVLADDEVSYDLAPSVNRTIMVDYHARTTPVDGSYEVKLYMYPIWVNAQVGYRLEYWLYNLDRSTYYNVTPYVELGATSAPFDPRAYGIKQTVTVAVDLNKVDGRFAPYRHVQTFQIALLTGGDLTDVNWSVNFTPEQLTEYGAGLYADMELVNTNYWRLRLGNDLPSKEIWLQTLYERIDPLRNQALETYAPTPTHFRVILTHNTYEFSVEQWDEALVVNNDLAPGEVVYLQWIRRNAVTDLQLGMSALPVRVMPNG